MVGLKRTSTDTHMRVQCSHASVGLAQARPKYRYRRPGNFRCSRFFASCLGGENETRYIAERDGISSHRLKRLRHNCSSSSSSSSKILFQQDSCIYKVIVGLHTGSA